MKKLVYVFIVVALWTGCGKEDKDCPEFFTGSDCNIEIAPSIAILERVDVAITSTGWDVLDNPLPEPFIVIKNSSGMELSRSNHGTNTNLHTWAGSLNLNPGQTITLEVYDYDSTSESDFIAGFTQKMYVAGNNFQTIYTGTANGVTMSIQIKYIH